MTWLGLAWLGLAWLVVSRPGSGDPFHIAYIVVKIGDAPVSDPSAHRLLLPDASKAAMSAAETTPIGTSTVVDNRKPRVTADGAIVNAHQGHMTRFQQTDGSWRYYWVGSAWAPCEPVQGKCVDGQPEVNGECLESKTNGCLSMVYGACGAENTFS